MSFFLGKENALVSTKRPKQGITTRGNQLIHQPRNGAEVLGGKPHYKQSQSKDRHYY